MGLQPDDPSGRARLATDTARESTPSTPTSELPRLFVCDGDDGGPRFHPCRRVQEALRGAGIEYEKTIAGHGSPIPFLRKKGMRDELHRATGTRKLPTLKLADGTVIPGSRAIISWVEQHTMTPPVSSG